MSEAWEVRRKLRWGSEVVCNSPSEEAALSFAIEDIATHGNVGRVELIDQKKQIIYYDVYEELS